MNACKKVAPNTKILVISAYDDHHCVKSMARLGVRGYLVKTASADDIRRSVRDLADGNLVFPRAVAEKVLGLLEREVPDAPRRRAGDALTGRESEVLGHIGEDLTNREIGSILGISIKTVEAHVRRLLLKLRVTSRTQAAVSRARSELAP